MPTVEPSQVRESAVGSFVVTMAPDCTIRSIEAACQALRRAIRQPGVEGGTLSIDCAAVEQADITFVQLLVSASKTTSARNVRLALQAAPPCVHDALGRSGVQLGAEPPYLS